MTQEMVATNLIAEIGDNLEKIENNDVEAYILFRDQVQEKIKKIREYVTECDERLKDALRATNNDKGYTTGNRVIKVVKEKKTDINTSLMTHLLTQGSVIEKEMAIKCLSFGQSAWKSSQVQTMGDTLGRENLISIKYTDKLKISDRPINQIEGGR